MSREDLPARRTPLDRTAIERVLARAAELQAAASSDPTGGLTDDQIVELGKEVGLTPDVLRQAIAEERGRVVVPRARGVAGMWLGADTLSAARMIPGTPAGVLATLDAVMRNELPFDVLRRFPDRMTWQVRRTFIDAMRAQFGRVAEAVDLKLAEEVSGTVVPVDDTHVHVRLDASLKSTWRGAANGVAAGAVLSIAGGLVFTIAGALVFVTVPIFVSTAALSAFGARRAYRRTASRVAVALEQMLDRLEFGPTRKKGNGLVERLLG